MLSQPCLRDRSRHESLWSDTVFLGCPVDSLHFQLVEHGQFIKIYQFWSQLALRDRLFDHELVGFENCLHSRIGFLSDNKADRVDFIHSVCKTLRYRSQLNSMSL